jgi:hypothetical protein
MLPSPDPAAVDGPSATGSFNMSGIPAVAGVRVLLALWCSWLLATAKAGSPATAGILGTAGRPAIAGTALTVVLKLTPNRSDVHIA